MVIIHFSQTQCWAAGLSGPEGRDQQLQAHAGTGQQLQCGPTQAQDDEGLEGDHEEEEGESYLYCEYEMKSDKTKSRPQSMDLISSLENPAKLNYMSFRNINIIENEYYFNKAISIFRIASREYYFPQPSFC